MWPRSAGDLTLAARGSLCAEFNYLELYEIVGALSSGIGI